MQKIGQMIIRVTIYTLAALLLIPFVPQAGIAKSPVSYGVSTGASLLNMSEQDVQSRLTDMKKLGVSWIRVDFSWSVIQPDDDAHYDYRFHDRVVAAAADANIKVLALVAYTPAWARESRCVQKTPQIEKLLQKCEPRDPGEFAHFAKEVAQRYGSNIGAWEVWNEPNLVGYWRSVNGSGKITVNPAAYGRLASLTAEAIHQITPQSPVLTGGLAPMFEPKPSKGMRQSDFLRLMLNDLHAGSINAIGVHPYSWPALPSKKANWNAFYTVDNGDPRYNLLQIIAEAGRQDLTFWATEYGAPTVGKVSPTTNPRIKRPDHVNEQTQAKIMQQGIELWQQKPSTGPIFVHSDSDTYLPQALHQDGFGLRRRDGSLKPAYTMLQKAFGTKN